MIGSIAFHVHGKDVFMYRQSLVIFTLGMCINIASYAASDGTLGTTSSGTVDVTMTIASLVQISKLSDIALGAITDTSASEAGSTQACIYTNVSGGTYTITATSSHPSSGDFRVNDGGSNYVTYTAQWSDQQDGSGSVALTSGAVLAASQENASTTSLDCDGGSNARFSVTFPAGNLFAAVPGTYTDTVTLLVAPV